jgi:hypothetical protein
MSMNRVQFQAGLSLPAFLKQYSSERACEQALLRARWREGFVCPACEGRMHSTFLRGEKPIGNAPPAAIRAACAPARSWTTPSCR